MGAGAGAGKEEERGKKRWEEDNKEGRRGSGGIKN